MEQMSVLYGTPVCDFQGQHSSCWPVLHSGANGQKQVVAYKVKITCSFEAVSGTSAYSRERELLRHNSKSTFINNISQSSKKLNVALQPKHVRKTTTNNGNFHIMTLDTSMNSATIKMEKSNKPRLERREEEVGTDFGEHSSDKRGSSRNSAAWACG